MQALIGNQNNFQNITKGAQKSRNIDFKKNNITEKHAENHIINISDRNIVSSNKFSTLTNNKSDIMVKHAEDQVINIPDSDTSSSN